MIRQKRCRQQHKTRIRFRAPLFLLFGLCVALAWDTTGVLRMGLLCAILHELGHMTVYRILYHAWPEIQFSPWGICLRLRGIGMTPGQELLLAAAGPVVNFIGCGITLAWMRYTGTYSYMGYWFTSTNILVGCANLLPFPGLDGSRILHALFE